MHLRYPANIGGDVPTDEFRCTTSALGQHDDVTALDRGFRQQLPLHAGAVRAEDELVHEQVVADEEVVLHRAGRDLERLDDERAHEQGEDHGDDDRLEVLAGR
jgi:hypothetical protein